MIDFVILVSFDRSGSLVGYSFEVIVWYTFLDLFDRFVFEDWTLLVQFLLHAKCFQTSTVSTL